MNGTCRCFKVQPFLVGSLVAVNAGLCVWAIPRYGLAGAACVYAGIYLLQAVLALLVNLHALRKVAVAGQERTG